MLHKLSLDANSTAISYWQELEYVCKNKISFGKRIMPEYYNRDLGL